MNRSKRLIIATLSGLAFGFVCYLLASSGGNKLANPVALQIIFSRTLIGFAIGINCIPLAHWSVHGLVMGLVFSIPLAFSGLMAPESVDVNKYFMFVWTILLGMVYGFLTEVVTSVIFRAKMKTE